MALTRRQTKLYIHTCDIYLPASISFTVDGDIQEATFPSAASYSAVKCYRDTNPEWTELQFFGRTPKSGSRSNIEVWHFDVAQSIKTGCMLKFTTSGHPEQNEWFVVLGDEQVKNYRANKLSVLVVRATKPAGVA